MNKVVCITGLCGAGKSLVSDFFVNNGFQYVRFGQLTMDELKKRNLEVNEANERIIREDLRKIYGMAAYAILNLPKFDELIKNGNVIADGLYSFEEYKILKEHFGDSLVVIAVYSSPKLRYERLENRTMDGDVNVRNRPLNSVEAKSRDFSEIENLNKGGTIAMSDFTILNTKDINYLNQQIKEIYDQIR
ncbi:MAG: AAA family ATPase [Candidatus Shapirobacteria bacterium]|jgi:dephospho-CoA kinase